MEPLRVMELLSRRASASGSLDAELVRGRGGWAGGKGLGTAAGQGMSVGIGWRMRWRMRRGAHPQHDG